MALWHSTKLDPVSGVTNVDGVAVLYTHRGQSLRITALDPRTGTQLWAHEASASQLLPGIPLSVHQVGDKVVYLRPSNKWDDRARLVVVAPRTGRVLHRSQVAVFF
ncbi:MAG TPA: PQQ-binding-like beta-propeller repeat protein, partial [Segeticoccus sp.]|uniref:outer membrane protein assembly factor BamB family protein n=1 Tax=Segeticoccus sp. TaxID=2706531 RepID=UPI002D80D193